MELAFARLEGRSGHRVGRELLAELYQKCTDAPLPPIETTPRGKPCFVDSPWHFSISHTPNHAFCALSRQPVGMDAEEASRTVNPRLMHRYLSPAEQQRVQKNSDLLRLWVLKEALAKLTGQGIGDYLKNTDFHPNDSRIQEIDGCIVAILEGDSPCFSIPTPT